MAVETTYTKLRENLAAMLDQVTDDREVVIVRRKGALKDVAIVSADELAGLMETAHLLRSPKNAERLRRALRSAERGAGKVQTVASLRRETGLGKAD